MCQTIRRRPLPALASFAIALLAPLSVASEPVSATGFVFAQTNAPLDNELVIFPRAQDGTLGPSSTVSTGGAGTGMGLGSQGAVVIDRRMNWLFVVNAGSSELAVFRVTPAGPVMTDLEP